MMMKMEKIWMMKVKRSKIKAKIKNTEGILSIGILICLIKVKVKLNPKTSKLKR